MAQAKKSSFGIEKLDFGFVVTVGKTRMAVPNEEDLLSKVSEDIKKSIKSFLTGAGSVLEVTTEMQVDPPINEQAATS